MATIDSKNLLVWVKAMSRGQALPLDASEIHESLAAAESYAGTATAYEGQTIKAKLEDGKYHEYILQPSEAGYVLEEVGTIKASGLKQSVMVVESLPTAGQEEGILYICGTVGSIWTGINNGETITKGWKEVFWDVTNDLSSKAPINNPIFTGVVKVKIGESEGGGAITEEVALKSYVEGLFSQLAEAEAPGIVSSTQPIPENYKAGKSYRVAEAGEYKGVKCEAGDLILVLKNYSDGTASNDDFLVIQANIDGAVTSTASATTVGEIVVFDAVTGKVIRGSGIQIASLEDAIGKAHSHSNKTQLDTYDKTQIELLAVAKKEANDLVKNKADKADTLAGYGITDTYTSIQVDNLLDPIIQNLNSKLDSGGVESLISDKVGEVPNDKTVKEYIDSVVGSGGVDTAGAIDEAKNAAIDAAKAYTDANICTTIVVPYSVTTPAEEDDPRVLAMQEVKAAIDEGKKFDIKIQVGASEHTASYRQHSRELTVTAVDHSPVWSTTGEAVIYTISLNLNNNTVSVANNALYTENIETATTDTQIKSAPSTNAVKQYIDGLLQVVEF